MGQLHYGETYPGQPPEERGVKPVPDGDGGPAFPMPSGDEPRVNATTHYNEGMSLRDWFAGQALAGLFAHNHPDNYGRGDLAEIAYEAADKMLQARKAVPGPSNCNEETTA